MFRLSHYSISFFFNQQAIKKESRKDTIQTAKKANSKSSRKPNGTFIHKKEEIMVGIENTIVMPAKTFIITFRLLEIIVP